MLRGVDAAGTGRIVERWYRSARPTDGADPLAGSGEVPAPADGRSRVEVVGLPGLAAELAELLHPDWEVRAVTGPATVSGAADVVVLDAPRAVCVAAVRRAAPHAELVATFSGPAPGPVRDEALRAGVACCVDGSTAAVVARYLAYVRDSLSVSTGGAVASAQASWPAGADRPSSRPATTAR
jgi:hypothetical protein